LVTNEKAALRFDVTRLSAHEKRKLFATCMNQEGFSGFVKENQNEQIFFTFTYTSERRPSETQMLSGR
jgi:hypothetical protein